MDSIKINGGSFSKAAVLSFSSEEEFVQHYNALFPNWLKENKRKETLKEVWKIAHDLDKAKNDAPRSPRKTTEY